MTKDKFTEELVKAAMSDDLEYAKTLLDTYSFRLDNSLYLDSYFLDKLTPEMKELLGKYHERAKDWADFVDQMEDTIKELKEASERPPKYGYSVDVSDHDKITFSVGSGGTGGGEGSGGGSASVVTWEGKTIGGGGGGKSTYEVTSSHDKHKKI